MVVIGSGNSATFYDWPDNPSIVRVGGYTQDREVPFWSNTGNNLDLVAPGEYIITLQAYGGLQSASGTSHSSPIVAGVIGLMLSANPNLTSRQLQDILFDTAEDGGDPGWDSVYGWGRVDAAAAVDGALRRCQIQKRRSVSRLQEF